MTSALELSGERQKLLERLLRKKGVETGTRPAIPRRAGSGPAPLSFGQQRLWFLNQLEPRGTAYNIPEAVRLRGGLDAGSLERALAEIARRHEVLRTVYAMIDGEPRQIVLPPASVPLPLTLHTARPAGRREAEAERIVSALAAQPFDLGRGPLLRATLVELDRDDHVLVLTLHHIATDGWSMRLLVRELTLLYGALAGGAASPLPELSLQYSDFADWQRSWLQGETLESQLRYWRERLADGAHTQLALPIDHPWPAVQTSRGDHTSIVIDAGTTAGLRHLAREHGVTLFMVLVGGLAAVLQRITGQDDILLGTPSAGRGRPEIEGLIGFFINTLVLRTDLSGDPDVRTLLSRVRETVLGAEAHQDLPFERLIDALELDRNLSRSPLFQVMLAFQNLPPVAERPGTLAVRPFPFAVKRAQFELHFLLTDSPGGLLGSLEYRTELFDAPSPRRLIRHFGALLAGIVRAPRLPVSQLPLLSPCEEQQLLHEWNDTATVYAWRRGRRGLHHLIEEQVARTPGALAASFEGESLTYAELDARANRLARHLRSLGCRPETRVGIAMERSLELLVALLGALKSGAAYVPLDPDYPRERLAFMLDDARPAVLLTQERLQGVLPATTAPIVCLHPDGRESQDYDGAALDGDVDDLQLAYVIYTSGSTGRPRGAMVPHSGICNRLLWMQKAYALSAADTVLQKTPYSFDVSVWEFFWPILVGARLAFARPGEHRDATALVHRIAAERVTVLHFVPSMLQAFLAEPDLSPCGSLRLVVCSGEALTPELERHFFERLSGADLQNLYGPTEASVDVTFWGCSPHSAGRAVPIGRPIDNIAILLLDHTAQPVPIGVAGELHIGGVGLARGYLGRADLTAERFVPDPFAVAPGARLYRTGDLARARHDGAVEFLGRIDHQVKVRGFRIEPGEIESVLAEHPQVREAVVIARDDAPGGGRRLVAYAVPVPGTAPAVEALQRFLRERLPEHMVPAVFVLLAALPLSPSGKVDRRALPAPQGERPDLEQAYAPPRTETELQLAAIWEDVLGVDRAGVHDNFFALGGDSILSLQVLAQARERGIALELQQLFQHQTIADLARAAGANAAAPLPPSSPFSMIAEPDRQRLPTGLVDAYPLTRLQAGMLFHSDFSPESAVYHDVFTAHLQGPFDEAMLREAVARVMAAHPVLRTSFDLTGFAEPLQLVHATAEPDLEVVDLRHLEEEPQRAALEEWLSHEKARPFAWSRAPLVRIRVHRRSDDRFQLGIGFHHAVLDGWSLSLLLTGLFQTYLALWRGEAAEPPREPLQAFRRFVALEREALRSAEPARYWNAEIAAATVSTLPRWPAARQGPGLWDGNLSAALAQSLRQLARSSGVPVKSVLLAAHARVLSSLASQAEVVTGLVANGRPEEESAERSLGLFLNTVPLRLPVAGGTWRELVTRVLQAESAMLPHRHYPSVELQRLHGRPLYEAAFNYVHFHVYQEIERFAEIRTLDRDHFERTSFTFLASFSQNPFSGDLHLRLEYDAGEFPAAEVESIAGLYGRVLEALAADPDGWHETAPLLSAAERHQILHEWNDTRIGGRGDLGLHHLIELQVERSPQAPAATFEGTTVTYHELSRRSNLLARRLLDLGCGPETRVGVMMERSIELVVALLGVLKAGAAYVPLDPEYPRERLAFMLEDSRPAVLLLQEPLRDRLPPVSVPALALETGFGAGSTAASPRGPFDDRQLAYVIYTSGSTGRPKGAMVHHQGIRNRLLWMQEEYELTPADTVLQKTPFSFDVSVWEFFWPLLAGARLVLARPGGHRDSDELADLIARERVSVLHFVPSMLQAFLEEPDLARCGSLRLVVASGEALPPELARRAADRLEGSRLENLYGPTEASVDVTFHRYRSGEPHLPIGRPIANTRIHLLDAGLQPVPPGAPGELCIAGVNVGRGYLDRPDLTAGRFVPDPWSPAPGARLYRTGDLARHLPAGEIDYLGRIDHQVKIRGFRIELGEIEAALAASPAVREAVVVAREDRGARRLVAYVTAAPGESPDPEDLRRSLLARLPDHMVPTAFVVLERLPLSPNGKLDRSALPLPEAEERPKQDYAAPRDAVERELAALWSEVLRVEPVGIHDDFFALGGDSILSLQIAARARQRGLHFSSREIFAQPTVAELARVATATPHGEVEPEAVTGPVPLTPIQHWFFGQERPRPWHFNQAVLFELRERPRAGAFSRAVEALLVHHDALRLRFLHGPEGWRQTLAEPGGPAPFAEVDLADLPVCACREALEAAAAQTQAGFDLARGPLLRAVLFHTGTGTRLLLVAHHLVVDGVSWRILLDDLATAYAGISRGEPPALPAKTTSFNRWAERLVEHAQSGARAGETAFWSDPARARVRPLALPRRAAGNGTSGSSRTVTVELPEDETAALLTEVPKVYGTQINDALLAALLLAYRRETEERSLLVDLEGHGREEIARDLEPVRTVGWFTTLFPVLLALPENSGPAAALRETRERLRALPDRGIGYGLLRYLADAGTSELLRRLPQAEVIFNYLGQLDSALAAGSPFLPAAERSGPSEDPETLRPHALEIAGLISGGRLQTYWTYSEHTHRREDVERLAQAYLLALGEIVSSCRSGEAVAYTPSDFPDVELSQSQLDSLLAEVGTDFDSEEIS